jgi:GntR family transcriptional regulator
MSATPKVTKQSHTRQHVLDLIEQLGVGTAIPSERQLSAELGVSRLTLRAALDDLAREGYLVRRRGSGTYVQHPKISQELTITSFSDDMRRRGMIPGSRTLSMTTILAGARLGRSLNVSPSEEIVVVKRLRLADGESMAIETLHIPGALVPGLTPKSLTGSFYDLLRDHYGVQIVEGIQAIEPTVTNEEESEVLGVPLHSPAFLFERTSRDDAGRTVEFVQSVYRGDRYRIVTELSRRDVCAAVSRGVPVTVLTQVVWCASVRAVAIGKYQFDASTIARRPHSHSGMTAPRSRVDGSRRRG